jgi:hypothetical protein
MASLLVSNVQSSLLLNTSDAPTSEAVVLTVLSVLVVSVLFAFFLAGPAPSWEGDKDDVTSEAENLT